MTRKVSKAERQEAIKSLREMLKPGDTVYTSLRSVSRSGMTRKIGVHFFKIEDGEIRKYWLTRFVAMACEIRFDEKTECLSVGGCGMDMGFHVVYTLASTLFPKGFTSPFDGAHRPDGGYALKHEWI
jgi:hypothetical protein